jgi:hypothetical protein
MENGLTVPARLRKETQHTSFRTVMVWKWFWKHRFNPYEMLLHGKVTLPHSLMSLPVPLSIKIIA